MISEWMSYLIFQKKNIHNSFDYDFFFKGLRAVFELDHSLSIGKGLSLLYKNFTLFNSKNKNFLYINFKVFYKKADFQREICEYIFRKVFFKYKIFLRKHKNHEIFMLDFSCIGVGMFDWYSIISSYIAYIICIVIWRLLCQSWSILIFVDIIVIYQIFAYL